MHYSILSLICQGVRQRVCWLLSTGDGCKRMRLSRAPSQASGTSNQKEEMSDNIEIEKGDTALHTPGAGGGGTYIPVRGWIIQHTIALVVMFAFQRRLCPLRWNTAFYHLWMALSIESLASCLIFPLYHILASIGIVPRESKLEKITSGRWIIAW